MGKLTYLIFFFPFVSLSQFADTLKIESVSLVVLGTIQDAGSPHPGCQKSCCKELFTNPDPNRMVVSLGLIDPIDKATFLFEASPDLPRQMNYLQSVANFSSSVVPNGIFITHAHIGHYTGLMYLGKEGLNSNKVPVFVLPKMKTFLENNGPWNQLIKLQNIVLHELKEEKSQNYSENVKITPFLVPHRDEYSETCGYLIEGPQKRHYLFRI